METYPGNKMFPGYIFIGLRTLDVKSLIVRLESTGGMLRAEGEGAIWALRVNI